MGNLFTDRAKAMIYDVFRKSDGQKVFDYQADEPVAWSGLEFDTHDHVGRVAVVVPPTKFGGRRILTKYEFRSLFQEAALKAIDRFEVQFEQATFLTDAQKDDIRTGFKDYHEAQDVNLDNPRWAPGLGLYVALGMMTAAEVEEVLRG